jgi:hypothetical protein
MSNHCKVPEIIMFLKRRYNCPKIVLSHDNVTGYESIEQIRVVQIILYTIHIYIFFVGVLSHDAVSY